MAALPPKEHPKVSPRLPTNVLFIGLILTAVISLYVQEKVLQTHLFPHNNDGAPYATTTNGHRQLRSSPPTMLFGDAKGSAKLLLKHAQTPRPVFDEAIHHEVERARCARYKLSYTPTTNKQRRRIFWGANIADDSWHAIASQAIETHGVFHSVAFVESNRTSMGDVRTLRFDYGSENKQLLTEGGMFGSQTKVTVDYYVNEDPEELETLFSLEREHAQRALIIEVWKRNGMTPNDIGYLSDTDETFSRDFLRAMQLCDVPQFVSEGKDGHNKCAAPKVYGLVAIFEGSPECASAEEIYHPALMIGECIEGIGDNTLHPKPTRHNNREFNWRTDNYTYHTHYSALHDKTNPPKANTLPSNVYFPLYNAADYRRTPGGYFYGDDHLPLYIGYHIHNFFDDMSVLRKKYKTYGHAQKNALTKPLSDMNREVNLMVRCALNNSETEIVDVSVMKKYKTKDERRHQPIARRSADYLRNANYANETGGAIPLAFRLKEYAHARHREMVDSIQKDEKERSLAVSKMKH